MTLEMTARNDTTQITQQKAGRQRKHRQFIPATRCQRCRRNATSPQSRSSAQRFYPDPPGWRGAWMIYVMRIKSQAPQHETMMFG